MGMCEKGEGVGALCMHDKACEKGSRDSLQGYPLPAERQPAPWHSEGIR